ncbi:hypothetical protein FRC09_015351, partial [Ceratobasidium sp. 395]
KSKATQRQRRSAAKYIGNDQTAGGRTRIPNLRYKTPEDTDDVAKDNTTKSQVLLDAFFPPPATTSDDSGTRLPTPVQDLPELSLDDVLEAIKGFKPDKAPGPDGLPARIYLAGADILAPRLLVIFRISLKKGLYPTTWRHSRTIVLRKPGKPDYSVAKAYRPIALLNVVGKILSSCVAKRLNSLASRHNWIPPHHFGGKAGHTTTDALHLLVKKIKDAWARKQVASALFLDVKGAFPHADPDRLAKNMRLLGVPRAYVRWTLAKLEDRTTCLAFDDFVSEALPIRNGIDQGCPLSVIYYLFYNSPLVLVPRPADGELCIGYIDDITLLVWGQSAAENNRRLLSMMKRRKGALAWSESHNSTFELDKTALIHFSRKADMDRPALKIKHKGRCQVIPAVQSHTLLGVILDQGLRFKEQCNKAVTKGLLWTSQIGRLAKMSYGASPRVVRRLYLSIAVPRFTYAADVWFTPVVPPSVSGLTRFTGSVGFAKKFFKVQAAAARAILGAIRSTPLENLNAFAGLLPIPYLLNEVCQRSATRLISVPDIHPLRKEVDRALTGRKVHVTPLQNILRYPKKMPYKVEQWDFKDCKARHLQVPPGLFPSCEDALRVVRTDQAPIQAFADGSRSDAGVGGAAVLRFKGTTRARSGARLGTREQCSSLEAELAGILCATRAVNRMLVVNLATIYSDSQLAVACVKGEATGAPKALLRAIRSEMRRIEEREECMLLSLLWCPGHQDIVGSVEADREAKAAAQGKNYPRGFVPKILLEYRPVVSRSVAKGLFKEANKDFALGNWGDSRQANKLRELYPNIDPSRFLASANRLPRSQASLLFRLITGHIQLQRHLHSIHAVDSPICEGCGDAPETVAHFILRCP